MNQQFLMSMPGIGPEEMMFIQEATKDMNEDQQRSFIMFYNTRRKDPQTVMLCTLIGFLGINGVQRFLLNQIGMGILYLFTGGLCLIGTIVDLINYQKMTLEYNQKMVIESVQLVRNTTKSF
jgi:TM2 domain-containing membrane protein YozV